jgi:hypothetical protein
LITLNADIILRPIITPLKSQIRIFDFSISSLLRLVPSQAGRLSIGICNPRSIIVPSSSGCDDGICVKKWFFDSTKSLVLNTFIA